MNQLYHCYASAAFGMEGLVSKELKSLGLHDVEAGNGFVLFSASGDELFLANMEVHFSDRLYIILASGECKSFEDLFQLVSSVRWSDSFSRDNFIDISCKCSRSQLMSQRDCQSITKKAIIENVKKGEYDMSGYPFPVLSAHAKDLIFKLLQYDPKKRLNISQINNNQSNTNNDSAVNVKSTPQMIYHFVNKYKEAEFIINDLYEFLKSHIFILASLPTVVR